MNLGHVRELFSHRAFDQLLTTRLTGQFSDGLLQAGLVGVVLFAPERAASPTRIAVGFAVLLLPFTVLAPLAGVLLDRWSRVAVLRWANLARALLIAVTALATATSASEVVVFGSALVALALNRLVLAALGASLPRTVPAELLVTGNALAPTVGTFVTVVGGGIGLALRGVLDTMGDAAPFAAASVGYLVAALTTLAFGRHRLGPVDVDLDASPFRRAWDDVRTGVRQIARTPAARRGLQATMVQRMLFGALTVWTIVTIRFLLDGTSSDEEHALAALGSVALAAGVGLVAASTIAPTFVRRRGARATTMSALTVGAVGALIPWVEVRLGSILVAWALVAAGAQMLKITVDTVLQRSSPDQLRGRVFVAYDLVFNVSFMVGVAVAAAVSLELLDGALLPVAVAIGYLAAAAVVRSSGSAQWES
jgi:MFS family permease